MRVSSLAARSMENLTSAEVSGSPLWKTASSRRVKVQVVSSTME